MPPRLVPGKSRQRARRRVHVSTGRHDTQLQLILDRLGAVDYAADANRLARFVGDCASWSRLSGARTLELVSHSSGEDHLLDWNGWRIGEDLAALQAFCRRLRKPIATAGIAGIRLVGCHTATSPRGIAALRAMKEILRIEVHGTDRVIDVSHFGSTGVDPDVLVEADRARPIAFALPEPVGPVRPPPPLDFAPTPFRGVPADGPPVVASVIELRAEHVATQLAPWIDRTRVWDLPGLLLRPDVLLAFRIDAVTAVMVEILSAWRYARVFPPGRPDGIVYAIDGAGMRAALRADPAIGTWLDSLGV